METNDEQMRDGDGGGGHGAGAGTGVTLNLVETKEKKSEGNDVVTVELSELSIKDPQTIQNALKSTTTKLLGINSQLGNVNNSNVNIILPNNEEDIGKGGEGGALEEESKEEVKLAPFRDEKEFQQQSLHGNISNNNNKDEKGVGEGEGEISIVVDDQQNTSRISIVPSISPEVKITNALNSSGGGSSLEDSSLTNRTARQLFKEKAAQHGGDDSVIFMQAEQKASAKQRTRTTSNSLDVTVSRNPSTTGKHEKKIGHRRVDDEGEVTYKKIQSKQIMGSIQLGIQQTVGSLASKPKRDLLMNDFWEMETISFPSEGSSITPAHHYSDFRFKVYAPIAFRYFRDLFGIAPEDFLMSMCSAPLTQLSNPGASGSLFYLTNDDEFIIKTVQKKECEFLQKLLPGYYMNLSQNPRTLLPKFFGLYCFHYNAKNVRLVAMNNLLPSDIKMHAKYDLKGSTFRRKASKAERQKASPTFKDLDFMEHHPSGIFLETDKYNALMKTIQRDCMVLESFQIMDYSLLVGIHNLDLAAKEKREERIRNARAKLQRAEEIRESHDDASPDSAEHHGQLSNALSQAFGERNLQQPTTSSGAAGTALNRTRSMNRQRLVAHSTAMESITANMDAPLEEDEDVPAGGIPARSENDERLILYIGIIDILQSYRLEKKLEHTFKSIIYNGDTVSVCRPSFYAQRFQNFMGKTVFKKTPTFPLKHSPSKRKSSNLSLRTPQRTPSQSISVQVSRPLHHLSGMSTPPPAFEDIDEEETTNTSSSAFDRNTLKSQKLMMMTQRSYVSSNRSVVSSATDDFSDDELLASGSGTMSPKPSHRLDIARSPRLSKSKLEVTTIGCSIEELSPLDPDPHTHRIDHDDPDSGNEQSSSENQNLYNSLNRRKALLATKQFNQVEQEESFDIVKAPDMEESLANGKPHLTSTKTTIINTKAQTYTSTLVVNDVRR